MTPTATTLGRVRDIADRLQLAPVVTAGRVTVTAPHGTFWAPLPEAVEA